ncbi:hypothetical protein GFS24_19425 [Chitinophaga sp. SYP-B3965]|uniref:hypothetical protein n=1 Tax=Chitinophaga sp. SYP-B3965 TaxID=2663120 RepID=UPI001299D949|nr:hypothetical protein [Chitinophaga sp. SYP-B3965]MRG47302.1 hypothetical protein [Chitinophaga sp. SYP-B3965]
MKFLKTSLLLLSAVALTVNLKAQDFEKADLKFLAGQTKFNIEYDYDNMKVVDDSEETYKKERMAKLNAKQPGKGERWAEKWVNARQLVYEPMFEELISKYVYKANGGLIAKKQADAKYTVYVKTLNTDPGWNVVVMKRNPKCVFEISVIEISSGKVMAKGEMKATGVLMGGSDWEFDPTPSIKECYAKAGKEVGKKIAKAVK